MTAAQEENAAQFRLARWKLPFLAPSWVGLVALLVTSMGIFAYRLVETLEHYKERNLGGQVPVIEVVWETANIAFSLVSVILTIVEISKYTAELLTPFFLLSSTAIKITLGVAELALDIVVYQLQSDRNYSIVGLALDCGVLAVTILTFVYALLTFRRLLKYEEYNLTDDAHQLEASLQMGNNVHVMAPGRQRSHSNLSVLEDTSTSYASQTTGIKRQLDQAIGAELGWTSRQSSPGLTAGAVHSGHATVGAAQRHTSWAGVTAEAPANKRGIDNDDDDEHYDNKFVRSGGAGSSHDRHSSIPTVVVGQHAEEEDDSQALLSDDGPRAELEADISTSAPHYHDHPSTHGRYEM